MTYKGNAIAEFLTDRASKDYEPTEFDFPDEYFMAISHDENESLEKTCWRLYFDRHPTHWGTISVLY